jgi:hypothetical protein
MPQWCLLTKRLGRAPEESSLHQKVSEYSHSRGKRVIGIPQRSSLHPVPLYLGYLWMMCQMEDFTKKQWHDYYITLTSLQHEIERRNKLRMSVSFETCRPNTLYTNIP